MPLQKTSWNSGKAVGQKKPFKIEEIHQIEQILRARNSWHDMALLALGLDSMLRSSDLLNLKVRDITYPNGLIRSLIATRQKKSNRNVFPVLTPGTKKYLIQWIGGSQKTPENFLFTRFKNYDGLPITRSHYGDIVKGWAEMLGLEPNEYSTHSVRRSKPVHMYSQGEDIVLISKLLGHKSVVVTAEYLGITQNKAEEASLRHEMVRGK